MLVKLAKYEKRLESYINVNFLIAILHCSYARCYHWKKLGEVYRISVLFLTAAYESTVLSKQKVKFKKGKLLLY